MEYSQFGDTECEASKLKEIICPKHIVDSSLTWRFMYKNLEHTVHSCCTITYTLYNFLTNLLFLSELIGEKVKGRRNFNSDVFHFTTPPPLPPSKIFFLRNAVNLNWIYRVVGELGSAGPGRGWIKETVWKTFNGCWRQKGILCNLCTATISIDLFTFPLNN